MRYSIRNNNFGAENREDLKEFVQYLLDHPELNLKYKLPLNPFSFGKIECLENVKRHLTTQFPHLIFTETECDTEELEYNEISPIDPEFKYKRFKMPKEYSGEVKPIVRDWTQL
jgi:hypothetical protein